GEGDLDARGIVVVAVALVDPPAPRDARRGLDLVDHEAAACAVVVDHFAGRTRDGVEGDLRAEPALEVVGRGEQLPRLVHVGREGDLALDDGAVRGVFAVRLHESQLYGCEW